MFFPGFSWVQDPRGIITIDDVFTQPAWEDSVFIIFVGAAALSFCQGAWEVNCWRDFLKTGAGPQDMERHWLLDGTVGLITSSFIQGPDLHVSGTPEHFTFAHWQATQENLPGMKKQSHCLFLHSMQAMLASTPSVKFSPLSTGRCKELCLTIAWPVSGFHALLETGQTGDRGSTGSLTSM